MAQLSKNVLERAMISARDVALKSLTNIDLDDNEIYEEMVNALDDAGIDGDREELKKWASSWFRCVQDCASEGISKISPGGVYWGKYYFTLVDVTGGNEAQLATIRELWVELQTAVMEWTNDQEPKGHISSHNIDDLCHYVETAYKVNSDWVRQLCLVVLKQLLNDGKIRERAIDRNIYTQIRDIDISFSSSRAKVDLYTLFTAIMKKSCKLVQEDKLYGIRTTNTE